MRPIRIAAAQFENKNGDKDHNLAAMESLVARAVEQKADVVSFHECCISAYTFVRKLSKKQIFDLAEPVPGGESVRKLIRLAREYKVTLLAGLVERAGQKLYNCHVCVDGNGLVAKHRKIHDFISRYVANGNRYTTFRLRGWTCGILTCYDNNIPENVRAVTLLGADILFMPHVTCCLPWPTPGAGLVDRKLWLNREADPTSLRLEFRGPKGREWLLKWIPARAYDNGIYAVFSNPVGIDDDQVRNGNAMIVDPFGDVVAESQALGDDIAVATCTRDKIAQSLGRKHMAARQPRLYSEILRTAPQHAVIDPSWDTHK